MHSYLLIPEAGKAGPPWRLTWDDRRLVLQDPAGTPVIETETARAHHTINLSRAFIDGTICFDGPAGQVCFKQHHAALAALREMVDAGLRADPAYRATMRARARWALWTGAVLLLIAGGLFAAFVWDVALAPDPPADSWMHTFRAVLRRVVAALVAGVLLGLGFGGYGLRLWWRIRTIERAAPAGPAGRG